MKVLSRSGDSLADVYDVEGSIAGIEELTPREVRLVHEMGGTIFSERLSSQVRRDVTAALAQDTTVDIVLTDLPAGMTRILSTMVLNAGTTTVARLASLQISARDNVNGREVILWAWDGTVQTERIIDNGGAAGDHEILGRDLAISSPHPSMLVGNGQPQSVSELTIRGITTSFGAGDITLTILNHILFSEVTGISSRGLPIPSW